MQEDPALTLRQGIERFGRANEAVRSERDASGDAAAFFRCHDTAHVVFGCGTSLVGEGTVKLWTIFGTTLALRDHLRGYAEADAFGLFRQYSRRHLAQHVLLLSANVPRTIRAARRMREPWPWSDHEAYLDVPLADVRASFGIEPVPAP